MDPTLGFVAEFRGFVADLTTPEKRNIVALTEIARDAAQNRPQAVPGLADVIIDRIFMAPPAMRLPALYLLDSIAKMVGEPYKSHFAPSLPGVFEASWSAGVSRAALGKLAATWEGVFPQDCVAAVRAVMRGPVRYPGAPEPANAPYNAAAAYGGGGADDYNRTAYPAAAESWGAGTGYSSGNAGYSGGNAGYSAGNAGYSGGKAGYSGGNAAYSTGNAGYSAGNAGYSAGNAGYSSENAAYSSGNAGYGGYAEPADRAWPDYSRAEPAPHWDGVGHDEAPRYGATYARHGQYHHDGRVGYGRESGPDYGGYEQQPHVESGWQGYDARYAGLRGGARRTPSPASQPDPGTGPATAAQSGQEARRLTPPPGMCHPVPRSETAAAPIPGTNAGAPALPLPDLLSSLLASGVLSGVGGANQPAGEQFPPTSELSPEVVKRDNPGAVKRLLSATAATKSAFLDVLFLRRATRGGSALRMSRLWYVGPDAWLACAAGPAAAAADSNDGEVDLTAVPDDDNPGAAEEPSVPVDEDQTTCALSGEPLGQVWDEARQEWRYMGAMRLDTDAARQYGVAPGSIVLASSLGRVGVAPLGTAGEHDLTTVVKVDKALHDIEAHEAKAEQEAEECIDLEQDDQMVDGSAGRAVKRDPETENEAPTELSPSMKRIKLENAAADAPPQ